MVYTTELHAVEPWSPMDYTIGLVTPWHVPWYIYRPHHEMHNIVRYPWHKAWDLQPNKNYGWYQTMGFSTGCNHGAPLTA